MKKNYEKPELEELDVKDTKGIKYDGLDEGSSTFDDLLEKK